MATTLSDFPATTFRLLPPLPSRLLLLKSPSSQPISRPISLCSSSSNRSRTEVEKAEEKSPVPNTFGSSEEARLNAQLRNSIESGNYAKAIGLVESMCGKGYQLDSYLPFVLLKALADVPDPDRAARLVELLESVGRQDKHVYNVFIGCLCKAGRVVAAFEILGRMRGRGLYPKSSPQSSIVKGLCDQKMLEAALATAEHFRTEYRCPPNWVTYGNLIECAIVTRGVEDVPALLDQMARDGLRLDNVKMEATCSMVIHNLCKSRKVDEALEFIRHLPLNGSGPHATSYFILLELFLILGKEEEADVVIDEMLLRLQTLKLAHFRAIVKLMISNGLVGRAREMIDAAVQKFELGVDMVCCSDLIAAYLEDNRMDLVIELIDFMTANQQFPNVVVYNTIISGLCNMGHTKEAIEVLNNMSSFGVPPNEATYNRIIGGLWSNGEKKMAVKMLERMVNEEGLSLMVVTYNIIVTRLSQDGMVDEGLEVVRIMEDNGLVPDEFSYNALLLGFCKAGRMGEAMRLFEEMLEKGCKPHSHTYQIILRGAITAGYEPEVVDLLNEMDEKEILPKDYVTLLREDLLSDHIGDT